jgi:hypothetical protein
MGITIHYNGTLDDRARLTELLDATRLYCAEQRWHALQVEERILGQVERVVKRIERDGEWGSTEIETKSALFPIDDTMRGFLITVHPKAEPLRLTFNESGEMVYYMALNDAGEYWENKLLSTQTQFAGVDTHVAVCEFLHWLQENYLSALQVYDEGGYYESGDANQLARAFDTLDTALDQWQAALENLDSDDPRAESIRHVMDSLHESESPDQAEPPCPRKKIRDARGKKIPPPNPRWKRGRGISANKN